MNNTVYSRKKEYASTTSSDTKNTALTAVALQDHLMRSLSLNLSQTTHRPRNIPTRNKPKGVHAVVNTGRVKTNAKQSNDEDEQKKEFVLDSKPPPLTLAQKLGLVESPKQLMTETDWQEAKTKSNKRDDSKQPCVICKEDFGLEQQVLLSCTHVFHRACIQAFERFTGKKTCPMCRKEQYQTRVIYEGASYYQHKCATRIQSLWRGYVVKCWYQKLRETVPPKNPLLRKKFYEQKLQSITDRMLHSIDCDVDGFLRDLDRSLEVSRDVFRQFDDAMRILTEEEWEVVQLRTVERGNVDCPICLTALEGQGLVSEAQQSTAKDVKPQNVTAKKENPKLGKISNAGRPLGPKRTLATSTRNSKSDGTKNTKFGLQVLFPKSQTPSGDVNHSVDKSKGQGHFEGEVHPHEGHQLACGKNTGSRRKVLLSCSHVFHQTCLEAFEEFAVGERRNVCPVCRSHYQKKVL